MNKLISKKKGLCFLLAILCALCMFFACGALCYRASAAEGEKLGVKDSVYGWEIATQNNLEFSQDGEWARFKETTPTIGADTIDVIFNRNGFDISQPIEFKIKADAMAYSTDDGWLGFFLCKDLTTHQLSPLQGDYLAIDIWYLEKDPYIRCRIGTSVVGAGSYLGNATVDPTVPTDGTYILKITVTDAHTEVSLRGNGHERKFTISEITSSYFTNGKLYLNSRFHNNTNAGNYDISFSKVKNGLPVKYVIKGVSNTQRLESIEAESFTLAAAPEMPEGRPPFAGWRASDGKVYAAGAQYTPTEEEKASDEGVTFYAVSDASAATVALEYESVVYDGSVKQPAVSSVTLNGQKIPPVYPDNEQRKNYSVTYSDNTMPGTASATITFEGFLYTGSVTKNFTIEKIAENQAGDNLVFTCSEATYAKMTTESALGADYTYTVKDEADEVVTAQTKLIAGEYAVTAVKTEETKVTTVTYTVTVNKDVVNTTGTNFELEFAEATYVKMTTESTLGTDYTYTVKNGAGETVTAETKLIAGEYIVTAVKETATTVETVTYTVTVGKELINTAGENLTFALAEATYVKMTSESELGADYAYTVKNSSDVVVTAETTLAVGTYSVTAVRTTATTIETVTYTVTIGENIEESEGENLTFTLTEVTYAAMTTETELGAEYTYTVKNAAGEVITAETTLAAGVYTVKAVKTTDTTITKVTYTVTVNKDVVNTTGTNFELAFAEATYAKMTTESTLGEEYAYIVKNGAGETVTAETKLIAGEYIVTAVKETATTVETVTYTVTVGKELINTAGDNLTFALADATYEKMTTESALGAEYTYTVKNGAGEVITAQTTLAAGTYNVTAVKQTATSIETITYTVTLTEADSEDPPADEPKSGCGASAGIAESGVAGLVLGIGLAFVVGLKKRSQKH